MLVGPLVDHTPGQTRSVRGEREGIPFLCCSVAPSLMGMSLCPVIVAAVASIRGGASGKWECPSLHKLTASYRNLG